MRLPLYKKYENYVYKQFRDRNHPNKERFTPKRDFFENSLAIFMMDSESKEVVYMIYKLNEPQHNALFITNNSLSEVIKDANHTWIMLTGDREELNVHYMGVVTDNSFSLVLIKYYDKIQVNQTNNKQLIEIC
jgi:fructoselysine-6-P-deglycase FrlB-like protein